MTTSRKFSRREMIGKTAAAFAIPYFVPSEVIGWKGRTGANDRIVIGNIGVGGMGINHVASDSAAICDVDDGHMANAAKRVTQGTPLLTKDFRRILDRKDIDAVMIATPDHWHAVMTVMACQAGKHVYCEKPTSRTIEEGRAMVNAARYYDRTVQIGAQGRSTPSGRSIANYVLNGMIGKVSRVDVWHVLNFSTTDWGDPQPVPASLDWNMWLGPAKWVDYNPIRCFFNFRWFMDFGAGFIRDRGMHAFSIVSWAMDNDHYKGVVTCEATGERKTVGCYDVPDTMSVTWTFQNPSWTLTWGQPGNPPSQNPQGWGAIYHGDKGELLQFGGDGGCDTEPKAKEFKVPPGGKEVTVSNNHRENWLNAIRTHAKPIMDVEIGFHVVTLCILGNIAWTLGRKVTYDFTRETFINDEEANRMLRGEYRAPWQI
jgi:predicted dehydrogenase